jgi:hypothetical protein
MSWQRQAQAYDDEALIQLGSSGLLRRARKQLASGKVERLEDEEGQGRFRVGEQQVTLLDAPLERSRCDCNASGVCVHILAAVLQTRERAEPSPGDETGLEATQELSDLSPKAVMKWAGKPGTRLAARLLASMVDGEGQVKEQPASIEIDLGTEAHCRYILGAGLDGVICDAPESRRKGLIAACLLYWLQLRGHVLPWPPENQSSGGEGPLNDEELRLLEQVRQRLKSMLDGGLMHLPQEHEQSLHTLAWSARGERLPRLSALLLRFAGEITAFRQRQAASDSQTLLNLLVSAWTLCEGLSANDARYRQPLRGQYRRDYSSATVGPLWFCGAYRYQSRSDARGLSLTLWDLESGNPLRINLGRTGEAGRSFNPQTLWQTQLPWNGGTSPSQLNGKVIQLQDPRISSDGRLSLSRETRLLTADKTNSYSAAIEQLGYRVWSTLSERLAALSVTEASPMPPLLIRPKTLKRFQIGELEQRWIGWARDREGAWLRLSAPVDHIHNERMEALNRLIDQASSGLWGLVIEVNWDRDQLSLLPVSLASRKGDNWQIDNPDLEWVTEKKRKGLGSWLRQAIASDSKPEAAGPTEIAAAGRLLNDVRQQLLAIAELGLDCGHTPIDGLKPLVEALLSANAPHLAGTLLQLGENSRHERLVRAYHAFSLAWRKYQVVAQTRATLD